ncbi:MAG: cupin domain-containing protein [Myxococcota bacterium]|nr:cupin domain-containing protein [Myxococcota bacterium]
MANEPLIRELKDVLATEVDTAIGVTIQVLLGPDDGMPNYYTRRFTMAPGGSIPAHRHDKIEHHQVILQGEMTVHLNGETTLAREGDAIYIPPRTVHAFENRGAMPVQFLCVVPAIDDYATEWVEGDPLS